MRTGATLVAVRAMAPVAAKPPKNTEATLPIPCEISSIFELCLSPVMLSATTQASSDSMPASRAMVSASGNSSRIRSKVIPYGKVKSGKPVGSVPNREPMVSVGRGTATPAAWTGTRPPRARELWGSYA